MHSPFLAFVAKEFRHILRDRRTMLILIGMPVVQILLFGFAISTEVRDTAVSVVTPVPSPATQRIAARLDASPYFRVVHRAPTPQRLETQFRRGEIQLVVVFAPRFTAALRRGERPPVQLIVDGCEPNQAQMVAGYAQQLLQAALRAEGVSPPRAAVRVNTRMLYNPQGKSAYLFVPGVMGMVLLLVCAVMTSVSIVREKETGTMEVLLASPVPPLTVVLSKLVPYLALSCLNLCTILLQAWGVLDVPIRGALGLLVALSLVYIVLSLGLGLLISTLVRTQMAAVLLSGMGLIMPTIILSGLMFPIESMPAVLQGISAVVPARWYISAVRRVMIEGADLPCVWREACLLVVMAAALIAVSVKRFKVHLS